MGVMFHLKVLFLHKVFPEDHLDIVPLDKDLHNPATVRNVSDQQVVLEVKYL